MKAFRARGGFADVAVLALVALVAAGAVLWSRGQRADAVRVEARYRGQVREARAEASQRLGLEWRSERMRLETPAGERMIQGVWHRWIESRGKWKAGFWQGGGHVVVMRDPVTGEIDFRVLVHELGHDLLYQHGVEVGEHHGIMRRHGIWGSG